MKNNLKEIIDKKGIKRVFLAEKLGVSKQALNAWVNHGVTPSLEHAIRLAELLDCEVKDIWNF